MEYLNYRGEFADTPLDAMRTTFRQMFPEFVSMYEQGFGNKANFDQDVEAETKILPDA
jgi:hypothetical protein